MAFVRITLIIEGRLHKIIYTNTDLVWQIIERSQNITHTLLRERKDIIHGKFSFEIHAGEFFDLLYIYEEDLFTILHMEKNGGYSICNFCNSEIIADIEYMENTTDVICQKDRIFHALCYEIYYESYSEDSETKRNDALPVLKKPSENHNCENVFPTRVEDQIEFVHPSENDIITNLRTENSVLREEIERLEILLNLNKIKY